MAGDGLGWIYEKWSESRFAGAGAEICYKPILNEHFKNALHNAEQDTLAQYYWTHGGFLCIS